MRSASLWVGLLASAFAFLVALLSGCGEWPPLIGAIWFLSLFLVLVGIGAFVGVSSWPSSDAILGRTLAVGGGVVAGVIALLLAAALSFVAVLVTGSGCTS